MSRRRALGVDVGGTFTDLAVWDGAALRTAKLPSTPRDQSRAVVAGAARFLPVDRFLHGTTVATNALLERRGARTALVTDPGFADVLEIGRQDRPSLYDSFADRPQPLVARDDRHDYDGSPAALERILASRPEAVAVSFLRSYLDPRPERDLAAALRAAAPDVAVSVSSAVAAEFREFERTSTTVINAYLTPAVAGYLEALAAAVAAAGFAGPVGVMRSSGGVIDTATAAALPAAILLSGPAGGVVAAAALGAAAGAARVISFDMGGTSTDVCRIEHGRPEVAYERAVEGYPCRLPAVAIHTVGAGGGSLGWVDPGGALRVGPASAGAEPGPASYGRGGRRPAVTDANLVLGRLDPATPLAGGLALDESAARAALAGLGLAGLSAEEVARGMVAVVEEHMAAAIRRVSIEEGADPREAALVAFGGAGGLHATALARRLEMDRVLVPAHAGVFSALGLLLSPPRADAARSLAPGAPLDPQLSETAARAAAALHRMAGSGETDTTTFVDARYRGQSHEITVPYTPGEGAGRLERRFHDLHRRRNGFARPGDPVEVVTVRAEAIGEAPLHWEDLPVAEPDGTRDRGTRPVDIGTAVVDAPVVWRPALRPGEEVAGPAVVAEPEATTYLAPGDRAIVDPSGALDIRW